MTHKACMIDKEMMEAFLPATPLAPTELARISDMMESLHSGFRSIILPEQKPKNATPTTNQETLSSIMMYHRRPTPARSLTTSPSRTRVIGIHKGCGGKVSYTVSGSMAFRSCEKCRANGMYGTPSPDIETEPGR